VVETIRTIGTFTYPPSIYTCVPLGECNRRFNGFWDLVPVARNAAYLNQSAVALINEPPTTLLGVTIHGWNNLLSPSVNYESVLASLQTSQRTISTVTRLTTIVYPITWAPCSDCISQTSVKCSTDILYSCSTSSTPIHALCPFIRIYSFAVSADSVVVTAVPAMVTYNMPIATCHAMKCREIFWSFGNHNEICHDLCV
jgi:hypothetical protein